MFQFLSKNTAIFFLLVFVISLLAFAGVFFDASASHISGGTGLGSSCSSDSQCTSGYCSPDPGKGCSFGQNSTGAGSVNGESFCQNNFECGDGLSCDVDAGSTYGQCEGSSGPILRITAPSAPTLQSAKKISNLGSKLRIEVKWTAVSQNNGSTLRYHVYRCDTPGCDPRNQYNEVARTWDGNGPNYPWFPNDTTYHDYTRSFSTVSWGTPYTYAVRAYNGRYSGYSNTKSVTLSTQCANGIDDDGDTFVDYPNDPDCASASDNNESNESAPVSGGTLANLQCSVTDTSIALNESVTYIARAQNGGEPYVFDWGGDSDIESATQTIYFDTFESGFGNWVNSKGDALDWTRNQGSTPSSGTGSSGDHTTGSGYYVYTEASGTCGFRTCDYDYNKIAYLDGPLIDFDAYENEQITFWYHMYGGNMGTLFLEVSNQSGSWTELWRMSGDQGNLWHQATVDLSGLTGKRILRFAGLTGPSYTSDTALDDITITVQAGANLAFGGGDSFFASQHGEAVAENAGPFARLFEYIRSPFSAKEAVFSFASEARADHLGDKGDSCQLGSQCNSGVCYRFGFSGTCGAGTAACHDEIDNDGDGRIDVFDPGCDDLGDNDESGDPPRPSPSVTVPVTYTTPGDKNITVRLTDSTGGDLTRTCPIVTVAEPPLAGALDANPISGNSPLQVSLFAEITSGAWAPTTNFTFWWDCAYSDATPTYTEAEAVCGDPTDPQIGAKFDNQPSTSYNRAYTYTNDTQIPITVRPIAIIQHGSQTVLGVDSAGTITVNPALSDVSCAPSSLDATPGFSRTFSASGGSGNYSWSVVPSADCSPTSGSASSFPVSCSTNGIRKIQVDDDDPDTNPDTCILRVVRPGFIEI